MMGQYVEMPQRGGEREMDLRADRMEALSNLVFLMRNDVYSPERMESYLEMLERVVGSMAADEMRQRLWLEHA